MGPKYRVEILDRSLKRITKVVSFYPLNTGGQLLLYTTKLSNYGMCRFRIATKDPLFNQHGDIFQPYYNHVRIYRDGYLVWAGIIVDIPHRTKRYVEIRAYTYLFLLDKVLIRHDSTGDTNYRTFNSGTMADAVQAIMTEAKADVDQASIVKQVTIGTIENGTFPKGTADLNNTDVSGNAWTFNTTYMTLKFDYRSVLYCITQLANYAQMDFDIDATLAFSFKRRIGANRPELLFEYSNYGSIEDYDVPLWGNRMANALTGVAADNQFNIIKAEATDQASIAKYGKIADVAAYIDVKNKNALNARLNQEITLVSTPDAEMNFALNDRAYPLGEYQLGDTGRFKIDDGVIQVDQMRRIVGIDVKVENNGAESLELKTNKPREGQ